MKNDFYILNRDASNIDQLKVNPNVIYIDPPFGLNRNFSMTEHNGDVKEFSDHWDSMGDFTDWYADIIEKCFASLNKDGWLYCHNNHLTNALVLSKLSILNKYDTNISWKRSNSHNNIKNGWGNQVDSILVFKKGKPYFQVEYAPLNEKYADNSFNHKDDRGNYALGALTGEKSRIGHRYEYKGYEPVYGWRKTKSELEELDNQKLVHFGKNKLYKKIYIDESKGVPIHNIWTDIYPISRREGRIYPTQKPVKLLERIITTSCPEGGLVVDPFCGGGTTLAATMNVGGNRKCITADLSQDACNIAYKAHNSALYPIDTTGDDVW